MFLLQSAYEHLLESFIIPITTCTTTVIIYIKYKVLQEPIAYGIRKHTARRAMKHVVMVLTYSSFWVSFRYLMEYDVLSKATNFSLENVLSDHCMYNVSFEGNNSKFINFYPEKFIQIHQRF